MDFGKKYENVVEKSLNWFDKQFSYAYSKMSSDDIGKKIIGLIQGFFILYIYLNYSMLFFVFPVMLCIGIFEIGGKSSYIPQLIFSGIVILVGYYFYKNYYIPEKCKSTNFNITQNDTELLMKVKIFFGLNAFAMLTYNIGDFAIYIISLVIVLDIITIAYLAKAIKTLLIIALFVCIVGLSSIFNLQTRGLYNISGVFFYLYLIYIVTVNFRKIMFIISHHDIIFQWILLSITVIYGVMFFSLGERLLLFQIIGVMIVFAGYFIFEYFAMKNYEKSISLKKYLEQLCVMPIILLTLGIAVASVYNKVQNNHVDTDNYADTDNMAGINDFDNNNNYHQNIYIDSVYNNNNLDNYSGAAFGNGFETPTIAGLGAFSAGNTLNFGDTSIATTIDIPEFQSNPYMLFTTNPTANNFHVVDVNGMTQISVVDGKVYDATHTVIGGLTRNPVNGVTTLNTLTNAPIMSMDSQNNIYAGTPETGHLVGRMDKGVAANTLRDMSGGIVSYTDHLGNTYGVDGKPLGSIRNV